MCCYRLRSCVLIKVGVIRGRELGGVPRAESECMSAAERKQCDCDQKTFVHSQKCTKLKHIIVFCNFLQSCF